MRRQIRLFRRETGFTLLELSLALMLSGLCLAVLLSAVRTTRASTLGSHATDIGADGAWRVAAALVESDLRSADRVECDGTSLRVEGPILPGDAANADLLAEGVRYEIERLDGVAWLTRRPLFARDDRGGEAKRRLLLANVGSIELLDAGGVTLRDPLALRRVSHVWLRVSYANGRPPASRRLELR